MTPRTAKKCRSYPPVPPASLMRPTSRCVLPLQGSRARLGFSLGLNVQAFQGGVAVNFYEAERGTERAARDAFRESLLSSESVIGNTIPLPLFSRFEEPSKPFFPTRHANETKPNGLMMKLVSSTASSSLREAVGPPARREPASDSDAQLIFEKCSALPDICAVFLFRYLQ